MVRLQRDLRGGFSRRDHGRQRRHRRRCLAVVGASVLGLALTIAGTRPAARRAEHRQRARFARQVAGAGAPAFSLLHDDARRLALLPGLGPTLARRIVVCRTHWDRRPDRRALREVPGLGKNRAHDLIFWLDCDP
ncbi:MAG: hypothetical protein KDB53_15840 [Planctomycetes bacterium]|nr:hypothetical protein [Planctomycetota bacterium]